MSSMFANVLARPTCALKIMSMCTRSSNRFYSTSMAEAALGKKTSARVMCWCGMDAT